MRLAYLVPLAFVLGCGGSDASLFQGGAGGSAAGAGGAAPSGSCVPGAQKSCACPGTAPNGLQVCAADGKTYGDCTGCPGGGGGSSSSSNSGAPSSGMSTSSGNMSTSSSSGVSSSSGGPCLGGSPNADMDHDGYTPAQGDCNDCDPDVNPGAVEVLNGIDDDCNGQVDDLPQPCDGALILDDTNPLSAAQAVEVCKMASSSNLKDWGLLTAQWLLPDGSLPSTAILASTMAAGTSPNYDLGHGLLSGFGTNAHPQGGARLLALSSGTARAPTDAGYVAPGSPSFDKGYSSNEPQGFPKAIPACPGLVTGDPHDGIALELTLRPPTNGHAFSFDFNFYASDWNQYLCGAFNDLFLGLLTPLPAGQADGNVCFDSGGNTISVNTTLLNVCSAATCALGTSLLVGTGFDTNGATGWLRTTTPTEPGQPFKIRWTIYDSTDGVFDSTTLIDNFQWVVTPSATPVTTAVASPK